jgi:hypothetical protein
MKEKDTDTTNPQQSFMLLRMFTTNLFFVVPLLWVCCAGIFIEYHSFI